MAFEAPIPCPVVPQGPTAEYPKSSTNEDIPLRGPELREQMFDARDDRVQRHLVLATLRDNEVGPALGGFDELLVHRPNGPEVLIDDGPESPSAALDIADEPTDESNIRRRVHEKLDIDSFAKLPVVEDEYPLDDDDLLRLDMLRIGLSGVRREVVHWNIDRLALTQLVEVTNEQLGLE